MITQNGKFYGRPIKHELVFWLDKKNNNSRELRVEVTFQLSDREDQLKWSGWFNTDKSAESAIKQLSYMGFEFKDSSSILLLNNSSPMALNPDREVELVVEMQGTEKGSWPRVKWINIKQAEREKLLDNEIMSCLDRLSIFNKSSVNEPTRKEEITSFDGTAVTDLSDIPF